MEIPKSHKKAGKQIRVGVIGLGTIGRAVVEKILKERRRIRDQTGVDIDVVVGCDIDPKKKILGAPIKFFKNASQVLKEKIDILVELTGSKSAYERIKLALEKGLNVITADKFVISQHGDELEKIAKLKNVKLRFSAAVGGGMNLINSLQSRKGDNIISLMGILNGTTNYILTRMHEGLRYEKALAEAKEKGFAEANPEYDISGKDTACKLAILSSIIFSTFVRPEQVYVKGIENIKKEDIKYAKKFGYLIKLLGVCRKSNIKEKSLELFVEPCLVPEKSQLAKVNYERNAIFIKGDTNLLITGEGAGAKPTSAIVVSDIIGIEKMPDIKYFGENFYRIRDPAKIEAGYMIRFLATNKPGILAKITTALGNQKINIREVMQLEEGRKNQRVPVVFIVYKEGTTFNKLKRALFKIPKELTTIESILRIVD